MDTPDTGASPAASPTAPDFQTFVNAADAADLGRSVEPGDQPDASPASEPAAQAAPEAGAKLTDKPKNAKRVEQLDADIEQIRERLRIRAALREELAQTAKTADAPPASEPAQPTKAEWQRYRHHPDAPKVEDFEDYEDFVAAQSVFVADQRFEERQRAQAEEARSRERMTETKRTITTFRERAEAAGPDFAEKVDPDLMALVPAFALRPGEVMRPANVLMQECVKSEAGPALLLHFSTPDGQKDWQRIAGASTPAEMLKAFGRVEARFLSDGPSAAAPAAASPVSSAPEPPKTLGSRPPASPDREAAAVKAGDFRAYQAAADAADLAVRRR